MEAFYKYEQPTPLEEERFELPRRDIWYMIKSYIVKKSDIDKLYEWAKKQSFMRSLDARVTKSLSCALGRILLVSCLSVLITYHIMHIMDGHDL